MNYSKDSTAIINYKFEQLELGDSYSGTRNSLQANIFFHRTKLFTDGSIMTNKEFNEQNEFYKNNNNFCTCLLYSERVNTREGSYYPE